MARQAVHGLLGVLAAALLSACLGGQTGEPGSAECGHQQAAAAPWRGTTAGAAAALFAQAYEAPLVWQADGGAAAPLPLQDRLQLTIAYDGGGARADCNDDLTVPVTVTLATSQSAIAESGSALLRLSGSKGALVGSLKYRGEQVALQASLSQTAPTISLAGTVDALADGLPGVSASFASEP